MEKTQTPSDECLVSKFRRGDKNAFIILLQRHTLYIKKTIRKYTADREEANDLFQEISIHLYNKLRVSYKEWGMYAAWQCVVIHHFLHDYDRKKKMKYSLMEVETLKDDVIDDSLSPKEKEQKLDALMSFFEELPQDYIYLLELKFWRKMSYQEVADFTGINRSTVVQRIRNAYSRLRKKMQNIGYDDGSA